MESLPQEIHLLIWSLRNDSGTIYEAHVYVQEQGYLIKGSCTTVLELQESI
jgi:hypothetical protein